MSASDMQPMPVIPVEILLRHSAGLRALARGLLGDEHAAEDVVQETLAAAWAKPPGDAGRIGGWLRRVVRKRAHKRLRGEARRREREERASHSELLAPTDELAAQRETLRRVVDAVLGLSEPYQGVVLLRFFEDLPPREIAQRRGVPVATVNSQLQRALAMLRGSLDAQTGGERRRWALALASVTGRPRRTTLAPDPSHPATELARRAMEGIAVHWKLSIGLAGALLAGAGAVTLRGLEPQVAAPMAAREASAQASVQASGAREERAGDARIDDAAPGREPLGTAAAAAEEGDAIDEASRFELEVLVVDEHDQPRNGATVLAAPPLHPLNQLGSTGPDGRLRVAWLGPAAATTLLVGVSPGSTPERGLRRIELRAGEPARLRLVLRGSPVRSMGRMREGSAVGPALAPHAPAIRALPLGELTCFAAPVPYEREEREAIARDEGAARPSAGSQQTLDGLRGLGYASSDEKAPEVRKVVAHGFVLDENGEPVRAALVTARCDPSARTVRSDETGAYSIELPAGKLLALRAGGGDLGLASARFELDAEALRQQVAWSPLLDRGLELRGRLRTSAGRDTGGWLAVFEGGPESALWQDATLCAAGRFAIPNLPAGTGRLLFFETRLEPFPFHVVEGALPGGAELEVEIDEGLLARGSVALSVTGSDGSSIADAEVTLEQIDSGRVAWLRRERDGKRYLADSVPPGRYRAAAGTSALGFRSLGELEVVAEGLTDLGVAALAAPGKLQLALELAAELEAGSFFLVRIGATNESAVILEHFSAPRSPIALPAGRYALRLLGQHGIHQSLPLRIASGETTMLSGDRSRDAR